MMFGKFIDSSTVTGTQIRLDNEQWLRGRNFANTGDLNILRINSSNQIEFKQIPYVEGQGRLALYSELDGILTSVEYLYGQLTEVTGDIATIQGDIVDIQAEIDALQEEVGDFALKDLSNLTATAIPSGINLESVSIDQTTATGFSLRTKNQTTSVSGRMQIRTGTADGSFSSGGINIESGVVTNALGGSTGTIMTGATLITSGSISSGTRGSTGSSFLRSGSVVVTSATSYSGNSGSVGVSSGPVAALVTGATVIGTTGFASLITGSVSSQAASATANASSGNILVSTGGISTTAEGAIVNGNTGSATFSSGAVAGGFIASGTSNSNTGQVNFNSGNITNANNTGNTGSVNIFSGSNSGTGGSGSLSISTGQSIISGNTGNISINTGVAVSGNSGDINISTGVASGNKGNINVTAPFLSLKDSTRIEMIKVSSDILARFQIDNGFGNYGQFFFNRFPSSSNIYIGAMESAIDDNGADVVFAGAWSMSDNDGVYTSSRVFLQTNSNSGFRDAPNVAVNSGDLNISTGNSFVQGSYSDANSGNIFITTGLPQGSGTRGYIYIDAAYVSMNSKQIKDLADGTDPQDAVTVSQLGAISGSYALTDLSNLVATAIPDGVDIESVSSSSFSFKTEDKATGDSGAVNVFSGNNTGTGTTGIVDIASGDILNVASSNDTGIAGFRSGETNGSGNTGEVQIYSGNNTGTGSSGNIVISAGTTADDDKTTGSVEIRSGYPFGNSNSGSINIFSHIAQKRSGDVSLHSGNSTAVGDSGNILIYSGNVTSGIRGSIELNGQNTSIYLRNFDVTGYYSLFRIANSSPGSIGEIQFLTDAKGNDTLGMRIFDSDPVSGFSIDGWGRDAQNGGPFSFQSTKAYPSDSVSTLTGGDFNILAQSTDNNNKGPFIPSRAAEISSGNVNIETANAYISGSGANANTGNINLTTGTPAGTGTRGYVSINGDYITVNSKQIKNLADGTDPQDAVTVSQLGGISGSYALTDLSNLVSPTAIPDGVGLTSLTVPTIPNPFAAFEIKTSNQVGADGSGGVKLFSGSIFNPSSAQNTGIASLSTGLTLGSGNTGDVNIITGDNVGTGNSGNVYITTGASVVGTKGNINLSSREVNVYIPNNGRFGIENTSGNALIEFDFDDYGQPNDSVGMRIWNSSTVNGFHIIGLGQNNQNGGPFHFESTFVIANSDGVYSGGNFNIKAVSSDVAFSSASNISVSSGNVNITTDDGYVAGSYLNANSGNINLTTGSGQGTGSRGEIILSSRNIVFNTPSLNGRAVISDFGIDAVGNMKINALGYTNYSHMGFGSSGNFTFAYVGAVDGPTKNTHIGGYASTSQSGGNYIFHGSFVRGMANGTYKGANVYLESRSASGFDDTAANLEISSGDITVRSLNAFIKGTGANADTGNITLQTGTPQGAGLRGFITLDGDYVTASSTQIKDVADPTDPQDALTLNYFNNNIPNVSALDFYPLQAYNTYAPIYADATAGVLDPVTPTNPRPGWYFKNSAGSPQKINWYFFDGTVVSCQLQNFAAFAVVTLDSIASLPYFAYYTFPTGTGDIIPGFAHSQVVYSAPYVPSAVVGTKYLIYFGAEPDVFPYLPRIELTYNAAASGGDQGPTELVSTAAFSTESGASANNVQVMVENLGLNLSNFKAYFDLLIFPVFEESQDFYGSFYSSQTQDNLVPDVARAMTFNNTDEANGVSIVSNSEITFDSGGLYNIQFSAQFTHSNSSSQDIDIWLAKNGTNVPFTNSRETLAGQVSIISAWNFFIRVNAGDYVEIYWSSPSDDVIIEYTAAQSGPTRPETPSIILTVNKIIS